MLPRLQYIRLTKRIPIDATEDEAHQIMLDQITGYCGTKSRLVQVLRCAPPLFEPMNRTTQDWAITFIIENPT